MNKWMIFSIILIICLAGVGTLHYQQGQSYTNALVYLSQLEKVTGVGRLQSQHAHADYKIFVDNEYINLNEEKYQAPEFGTLEFWKMTKLSKFTHMHPSSTNIDVIHVHATGVTLGMFLRSIGAEITPKCLQIPTQERLCAAGDRKLTVLINDRVAVNPGSHLIRDHDKILISFGDGQNIEAEYGLIGDRACVKSDNCEAK
jgi:hypothetical protein